MAHALTFAGLDAIGPRVAKPGVSGVSTLLVPSTAGSATAGIAGLADGAASGTQDTARLGDGCDWFVDGVCESTRQHR